MGNLADIRASVSQKGFINTVKIVEKLSLSEEKEKELLSSVNKKLEELEARVSRFEKGQTEFSVMEFSDEMMNDFFNRLDEFQIKRLNEIKKKFLKTLNEDLAGKYGLSIMVDKLDKKQLKKAGELDKVKDFIEKEKPKEKFTVFLSAITKNKENGKETKEYRVARKLKEALEKKGVGVFWWEDENIIEQGWTISTKIAMGLAFSSVFVGMAFDTVSASKKTSGAYVYNCLLEGDDAYKTPNFFKYEVDTYYKLLKGKERAFIKEVVKPSQYNNVLPKTRDLLFFTYGNPEKYEEYPAFDNTEGRIAFIDDENASVEEICDAILKKLSDLFKKRKIGFKAKETIKRDDTEKSVCEKKTEELFHVAKNTPSDYYLEYAVIDEEGKDAAEHFTFFLEKTYDGVGKPDMRIKMVVNDWNNAFCDYLDANGKVKDKGIKFLSRAYNDPNRDEEKEEYEINPRNELACYTQFEWQQLQEDGQSAQNMTKPITWRYYTEGEDVKGYTNHGGKADIGHATSLCAEITFSKAHKLLVGEQSKRSQGEKCFNVVINYAKKDVIEYATKYSNNNLVIKFAKPLPETVEIDVVYDVGERIPCLTTDINAKRGVVLERGCKSKKIAFERNLKDANIRIAVSENCWERKFPYIVFRSADNISSKNELKSRLFTSGSGRTCLYCAKKVRKIKGYVKKKDGETKLAKRISRKRLFKEGVIGCNGECRIRANKKVKRKTPKRILCFNNRLFDNACFMLPENYENEYSTNAVIALIGASNAGKSTFISRFFNIEYAPNAMGDVTKRPLREYREEENIKGTFYTPEITTRIDKSVVASALKPVVSIDRIENDITSIDMNNVVDKEKINAAIKSLRSVYALSPYCSFIEGTPAEGSSGIGASLRFLPFVVKATRADMNLPSYVSFYDVPGVDLVKHENKAGVNTLSYNPGDFAYERANGVILFINGGGEGFDNNASESAQIVHNYIETYCKIKGIRSSDVTEDKPIEDVALAVVLCQFDRIETNFDINSTVRMAAPAFDKYSYTRSDVPKYIESCSKEIESYLFVNESQFSRGDLNKDIKRFKYRKFFAVSAIGHEDAILKEEKRPQRTKFISNPRNMEYVFAWLMYQTGIID